MKRRTIIILIVLAVIAVAAYFVLEAVNEKTADVADDKADVVINATDLIAAFDKDTASASRMYVDKLLDVTGRVMSVDTSGAVVLGEEGQASAVTASLDRRYIKDYQKLQVGMTATIHGKCTGYSKGNGEDLLESLGTTVELNFASVKDKK
jgi:hypothetical protein